MGKFGCRLYCWGCGGCCLITGIIMGILASMIPPGMVSSLQEGLFDLAYIDDTSQTEAEGLLADAELPIAESDAFKAWGKAISEGFDDCMKADFAFDWGKRPEDCVDGLHPTFFIWNATNLDTWGDNGNGGFNRLEFQEVGPLAVSKDVIKIEADTAYWDETGKARFRMKETFGNSQKCDATCEEFTVETVLTTNIWYGIFLSIGMGDGWTLAHAVAALPKINNPATINTWITATDSLPMDPHSGLPATTAKSGARLLDVLAFMGTNNAAKLGTVNLQLGEYNTLKNHLWAMGGTYLTQMAPAHGSPAKVTPIFVKSHANGVLGWGAVPVWLDPMSSSPFTFNFVGGASGRIVTYGQSPTAFMEEQMSSAFYHEGLGYVTQHYETYAGPTTNTHACAWDPDCPADCTLEGTANCQPLKAQGYDGGKIPGLYFGSAKGAPGFAEFETFVLTYYLVITMVGQGREIIPARYKGPDAEEHTWDFEGYLVHSAFKAASYNRMLENCNYPNGRDLGGGVKDSMGIDCNGIKDTSALGPYFGLPMYWMLMPRDFIPVGWDEARANAGEGPGAITNIKHMVQTSCEGNKFCSDDFVHKKGPGFLNFLHYAYEPHLGALVDVSLAGGLLWKLTPTTRHAYLMSNSEGYKSMPLFWVWNYLHLPGAINMDLAKLQGIPAALNGFFIFLLGQCMVSLIGGVACCFCGV